MSKFEDYLRMAEMAAVGGEFIRDKVHCAGCLPFIEENPRQILGKELYSKLTDKQAAAFAVMYDAARRQRIPTIEEEFATELVKFKLKHSKPLSVSVILNATVMFLDGTADNYSIRFPSRSLTYGMEDFAQEYAMPMARKLARAMNAKVDFTKIHSITLTASHSDKPGEL